MEIRNNKVRQIVTTARELFWHHGIKRITVEEICEKSEVSKMTFYKHFTNKTDLTKYIVKKMFNEGIQRYKDIINSDIPYIEKVKQIIQMKMEQTNGLSQEFINDLYKSDDPELKKSIDKFLKKNISLIHNDFVQAQKNGHIRNDVNPDFLVYMINKLVEISTDPQLQRIYKSPQEMIHEFVNFFYYGIIPDNQRN